MLELRTEIKRLVYSNCFKFLQAECIYVLLELIKFNFKSISESKYIEHLLYLKVIIKKKLSQIFTIQQAKRQGFYHIRSTYVRKR